MWEAIFEKKILAQSDEAGDPAHDVLHVQRVVKTAFDLAKQEGGCLDVVIPAAWLHDLVSVPKNDPRRSAASRLSAEAAVLFLKEIGYPGRWMEGIAHAIEAHSFSANIPAKTLEAKIVQDADRLDGLGAIGIARCFATGGLLKRSFYSKDDPFCANRAPNDSFYTVDHFYQKLLKTALSLQTESGKREGNLRVAAMRLYLDALAREISP